MTVACNRSRGLACVDYVERNAPCRDIQLAVFVLVDPVEVSLKYDRFRPAHAALLDTAFDEWVH